jgi:2-desacetyl-2-hydroxyethyl bacteriochlorophyllide A dehydrogenase
MRALIVEAPRRFAVADRADPQPGPGEALIRVHAAGICATDLATLEGRSTVAPYPITPGHEFAGRVERAPTASAIRPGDWVTIYPTTGCGSCRACAEGLPNHCTGFRVFGVHRDGGAFAERMVVPAGQLIPLPPALRNERGALVEPSAVAVHAVRRAAQQEGARVAVIGAGSIGLLVGQAAASAGAAAVVMADRMPARAAQAAGLGLDRFVDTGAGDLGQRLAETAGGPLDIVYDAVTNRQTLAEGIRALRPAGTLVAIGFPHDRDDIPLAYADAYRAEVSLVLSRNYAPADFAEAIRLIEAGAIDAGRMITGSWPLESFGEALDSLKAYPARHIKVLITP